MIIDLCMILDQYDWSIYKMCMNYERSSYLLGIHVCMVPLSTEAEFALGSGLDRKIESKYLINNHCFILDCFFFPHTSMSVLCMSHGQQQAKLISMKINYKLSKGGS